MLDVKLNKSLEKKSEYQGCCDNYGRRDGYGSETWKKLEQTYEGAFFKDSFHGEGSYKTLTGKEKTVFEGYFYSSLKDGYGVVSYPDGSVFEGLFKNNQAFGPGVYTHVNGRQDVGFWSGNKIVRLCRSVDFIIPRLASTSIGKLKLLQFQTLIPFIEENVDVAAALLLKQGVELNKSSLLYSNFIRDPRSLFFNKVRFDKVYFIKIEVPGKSSPACVKENASELGGSDDKTFHTHNEQSFLEKRNEEANNSVEKEEADSSEGIHVIAWNRSELCMDMLKQIFRFRSFEDKLSFKISDLMAGERMKFRRTGEVERICVQFLKMCSIGPSYIVKEFLCSGVISEELMDARGNNSIMFAVAADQHDIIHILLNYGADVNSFNDENLTPLNFCLLRRISQTYSLGNWEVCFLPPSEPRFHDLLFQLNLSRLTCHTREFKSLEILSVNNGKKCDVRKSVESLDRIFGDGMSIISEMKKEEKKEPNENDSVFCFQGEDDSRTSISEITLFHYRTEEQEKNFICGTVEPRERKEFQPLSYKTEEFLRSVACPAERDKYFFDFSTEISRNARQSADNDETTCFISLSEKIINIDKTIELLLIRGADPNLADAPKPSIHLAVYCKEPKLVQLLLSFGASPDSQSLLQEGLLTPLHLVVLMKPSLEQVKICELLLNYGASPEEETSPTFTLSNEEEFLDADHGRTPLQLLCTRKDAEYVDDEGFLGEVAYLLAMVSKRNKFFKGHSYLTLSMIYGNYRIMEAILKCGRINPNETLGKNLGTSFHVLVSTDLQKRTSFENSIRMCNLLMENGGNPNVTFETPKSLVGTCIDYGYREIENERRRRESEKGEMKKKGEGYNLENHLKVVEYIAEKSKRKPENFDGSNGTGNKKMRNSGKSLSNTSKIDKDMKNNVTAGEKIKATKLENSRFGKTKKDTEAHEKKPRTEMRGVKNAAISRERENSGIVEIKKHAPVNKNKFGSLTTNKNKFVRGVAKEEITKKLLDRSVGHGNTSKDIRSGSVKRKDYSEMLPERFRQSLLHVFGLCGGFNLNDLLLPYVVLRNGDLYYRFKGQKLSQTEQYSLI